MGYRYAIYVDDSGSHQGDHSYFLAGWLATVRQWRSLSAWWVRALAEHGLDVLHMKDVEARTAVSGMTPHQRDKIVRVFAKRTRTTTMGSLSVEVNRKLYDEMAVIPINGYHSAEIVFGNTYNVLLPMTIKAAAKLCDLHGVPREETRLVFAEQSGQGIAAHVAKPVLRRYGFAGLEFAGMRATPPLQAADMMAWFMHRKSKDLRVRPRHESLVFPVGTCRHIHVDLDRAFLRRYFVAPHEGVRQLASASVGQEVHLNPSAGPDAKRIMESAVKAACAASEARLASDREFERGALP